MGTLSSELAPVADGLSAHPRVYADANVPAGLVSFMRSNLHWDVLFVLEHDDLRRAADTEHFRLARKLRRTLVTLDRDYLDDGRFPLAECAGVLVVSAPNERLLARLLSRFDRALFLDEIGDLSMMAQAKLLRVLEDRRFERLGGNRAIEVDFRLISATNRPLDLFVRDSRFREDLYYRVNAFAIRLPSLRERQTDIPLLAQRFLSRYCAANGLSADGKTFSKEALDALGQYHWPGNIRELESTVARAALSAPGRVIRGTDIEFLNAIPRPESPAGDRLPSLRQAEREHILRILEAVHWNKKQAADVLEISRGTLYRKITEYRLEATPVRMFPNGTQAQSGR